MLKKILISLLAVLFIQVHVLAEMVIFNTQTLKYHKIGCPAAIKCTKNCIKIDKKEAIKRGGVPCKKCGG